MRLYSIIMPGGDIVDWAGTQADAKAAAALHPGSSWEEVDVPTDKPGLIAWLKANVTHTAPGE